MCRFFGIPGANLRLLRDKSVLIDAAVNESSNNIIYLLHSLVKVFVAVYYSRDMQ